MEIANGKADGNNVSWSISITSPMPMTLEHSAQSMATRFRQCEAGAFGSFSVLRHARVERLRSREVQRRPKSALFICATMR